ncbi:hypothetical protein [Citrobacter freundii]|nr:hypothetical protein [Citrobacter freundii]
MTVFFQALIVGGVELEDSQISLLWFLLDQCAFYVFNKQVLDKLPR